MSVLVASLITLLSVASATSAVQPAPQYVFANPPAPHDEGFHFPTVRESVAQARKIMHLTTIGDLVTTFPGRAHDPTTPPENLRSEEGELMAAAAEAASASLGGNPIGLMEYYADCDPTSGNPILLGINIATPYRNYVAGSNISLGIRWWPDRSTTYSIDNEDDHLRPRSHPPHFHAADEDEIPTPHTPAALPRFSLHGHLEPLSEAQLSDGKIQACFLRAHPDSIYWQPGNDIHTSHYVQLIVEHVYWFGGFGDRARIGWLPLEQWQNVTMEEVIDAKLPGEHKRHCRHGKGEKGDRKSTGFWRVDRSWWPSWL